MRQIRDHHAQQLGALPVKRSDFVDDILQISDEARAIGKSLIPTLIALDFRHKFAPRVTPGQTAVIEYGMGSE
jgi:hypothetical protein